MFESAILCVTASTGQFFYGFEYAVCLNYLHGCSYDEDVLRVMLYEFCLDHKLAASYNDVVLGIGPSQNHALAGLDHKLAAGHNDILLGAGISQNHVSAGANCNGYKDIPSVPDSKLASRWLASGGSQDLSPEEKEMIFRAAAMQPIDMNPLGSTSGDTEVDRPKPRRNVRISKDPQSIAARQRRQRISSKMRVLQKLVPGGDEDGYGIDARRGRIVPKVFKSGGGQNGGDRAINKCGKGAIGLQACTRSFIECLSFYETKK